MIKSSKIFILISCFLFLSFIKKDCIKISNETLQKMSLGNNGNCQSNPGCCSFEGDSQMGVLVSNVIFKCAKLFSTKDSLVLEGYVKNPEGYGESGFNIYRVLKNENLFCFGQNKPIATTNKKGYFKFSIASLNSADHVLFYRENYTHDIYHIGKCITFK